MNIRLDEHPDQGCWISDDRINAFVAAPAGGIGEIGFHGLQPVSRNSRLLVREEGVLRVSLLTEGEARFPFTDVEWHPSHVETILHDRKREYRLRVTAQRRSVSLAVRGPAQRDAAIAIRFSPASLFTGVHGMREWHEPLLRADQLLLRCRDRILLHEWLHREGPYAGDFLIPEPWRRILFKRRCRSGLATREDLREEYRDADIALYDAETWVRMGGEHFTASRDGDTYLFTAPLRLLGRGTAEFLLCCAEDPSLFDEPTRKFSRPASVREDTHVSAPALELSGHTTVETFFPRVGSIVRSSTVKDLGMTRATPGAYYWIWAWDNLVTGLEMARWNANPDAARIVRFINTHRDQEGAIPGRWTRSLEPLDTPPRGALDFLLLLLASHNAREIGRTAELLDVYPHAVDHLLYVAERSDGRGLAPNIGFYPDLPVQFGRTEQSAVAMEIGATYAFCRLIETAARAFRDEATAGRALDLARRIAHTFIDLFYDEKAGFLRDSIDMENGIPNESYPLFTLLFLQTPEAFQLVRSRLGAMARFARQNFQTPHGIQLLPQWDRRRTNEDALASWYPHWDLYLLKLFRRAGEREGIMAWLLSMERVLGRLGYVPEFLVLDGMERDDPAAWRRHGAVSNLNCMTGWYRAILEGLFGIEFDAGGMSHIPLDLPLTRMSLRRLFHRSSPWDIQVENRGGTLRTITIDGNPLRGCTKVPSRFHDGSPHRLDITYDAGPPIPWFTELVNAEVIESEGNETKAAVTVHALGSVDVAFPLDAAGELRLDGSPLKFTPDTDTGTGIAHVELTGMHQLSLAK